MTQFSSIYIYKVFSSFVGTRSAIRSDLPSITECCRPRLLLWLGSARMADVSELKKKIIKAYIDKMSFGAKYHGFNDAF